MNLAPLDAILAFSKILVESSHVGHPESEITQSPKRGHCHLPQDHSILVEMNMPSQKHLLRELWSRRNAGQDSLA
jgi:hypothetical protein